MSRLVTRASWVLVAFTSPASAQTLSQLIPHQVTLESVDYLGKRAAKITKDGQVANGEAYAIVKDVSFTMARSRWNWRGVPSPVLPATRAALLESPSVSRTVSSSLSINAAYFESRHSGRHTNRAWRATSAPHVSDPKATRSKNSWPSYAARRIMPHDGGESFDSLVDHFAPIDLQLLRANERARGARQA